MVRTLYGPPGLPSGATERVLPRSDRSMHFTTHIIFLSISTVSFCSWILPCSGKGDLLAVVESHFAVEQCFPEGAGSERCGSHYFRRRVVLRNRYLNVAFDELHLCSVSQSSFCLATLAPILLLVTPFYLGATIHSAVRHYLGCGGEWKGRIQDLSRSAS